MTCARNCFDEGGDILHYCIPCRPSWKCTFAHVASDMELLKSKVAHFISASPGCRMFLHLCPVHVCMFILYLCTGIAMAYNYIGGMSK